VYWALFVMFRFVLRRDTGSIGLADILVVVLVADAAQNAMGGEYKTITEGLILVMTLGAWNLWIDWMSFRYPRFERFAQPRVVTIIRNGRVLRANMRREMISEEELQSQLRLQGIDNVAEVKYAALEPDGVVSVVKRDRADSSGQGKDRRKSAKGT
jgi:uncharacterized membrane protein YcaP (DUF421 family)